MSDNNPIRVFVAHDFQESTEYLRVFEYLESRDNFFYLNQSDPSAEPAEPGVAGMKEELRRQIEHAEILVLPVNLLSSNEVLGGFQMDCAKGMNKPVLGIRSFGGTIAVPKLVLDLADDLVDWNDRAITDAIRKLARNEDPKAWDVIEFDMD